MDFIAVGIKVYNANSIEAGSSIEELAALTESKSIHSLTPDPSTSFWMNNCHYRLCAEVV